MSVKEILKIQQEIQEEKIRNEKTKLKSMREQGLVPTVEQHDDGYFM